jgi:hypothetical protein
MSTYPNCQRCGLPIAGIAVLVDSQLLHEECACYRYANPATDQTATLLARCEKAEAERDALRALCVRKDEAICELLSNEDTVTQDMAQDLGRAALALTPADLADCIFISKDEYRKLTPK